jgi:hypothetical protein
VRIDPGAGAGAGSGRAAGPAITTLLLAGLGSALAARSVARTAKVCEPTARPV